MLFKVALAVALGSIGLLALGRLAGIEVAENTDEGEQARLERTVAAQLHSLRENLFKR
jgi:hypothetical protein